MSGVSVMLNVPPNEVVWFPSREYGVLFQPWSTVPPKEYGLRELDRYDEYAAGAANDAIQAVRVGMVNSFKTDPTSKVYDFGACAGAFVKAYNESAGAKLAFGWDVNPHALLRLRDVGVEFDPCTLRRGAENISLWDVFEHLTPIQQEWTLSGAKRVFLSIPIYPSSRPIKNLVSWKHFKPGEHLWYFSRAGLVCRMHELGFKLLRDVGNPEDTCGREDIGSFVFERV